jgi:hypothetical protein
VKVSSASPKGARYHSGRSLDWLKAKTPEAPAVTRLAEEGRWRADDDDRVWSKARKLCRKIVAGLRLTEHEPVFDSKVLTFDVAKGAKPAKQCLLQVCGPKEVLRYLARCTHRLPLIPGLISGESVAKQSCECGEAGTSQPAQEQIGPRRGVAAGVGIAAGCPTAPFRPGSFLGSSRKKAKHRPPTRNARGHTSESRRTGTSQSNASRMEIG